MLHHFPANSRDCAIRQSILSKRVRCYDLRENVQSFKTDGRPAYTDGKRCVDELATVLTVTRGHQTTVVSWSLGGGAVICNYLVYYGDSRLAGALYVDGVIKLNPSQ
ncbi:alpha/beta hydrolase [Sodalis-like endosymbiont of Proechinophthirus fluctus]|uniref:alpha/beta hydrolase n=1 Tax=Sodalis-like endosymbiont of Proechinophthirus fluctus TaxID=1462730 RepID=UPI000B300997|nr:alpha/beta hydrolase [Sodalis-like endosymbiont of Proechinophthirus fluctus]